MFVLVSLNVSLSINFLYIIGRNTEMVAAFIASKIISLQVAFYRAFDRTMDILSINHRAYKQAMSQQYFSLNEKTKQFYYLIIFNKIMKKVYII
jgi:hypothetical protein